MTATTIPADRTQKTPPRHNQPSTARPNSTRAATNRTQTPDTAWVDAIPFRALLRQLISDTGLPAPVLAIAIGIPPRTAMALVSTTRAPRRIRHVDAAAMLARNYCQLTQDARRTGDATGVHAALLSTCPTITAPQLARLLRTDEGTAAGLLDGWMTRCEQVVVWRALALIDGWTASAGSALDDAAATAV